jgi:hypothetical protein
LSRCYSCDVPRPDRIPESAPPIARTFANHAEARDAILALEAAGLSPADISVVTRTPAEAETLEHDTGASEELEEATQHHHRLADLVDWLGRVESAAVPGFGAVLGTGDLWQDVSLGGRGRGSITGALVGLGFAVDEAANLEAAVFDGRILVVIQRAHDAAAVQSALGVR